MLTCKIEIVTEVKNCYIQIFIITLVLWAYYYKRKESYELQHVNCNIL